MKTKYRFFLRGPEELVGHHNESGRAVRLLKEKAAELGIPWTGVEEVSDHGLGEGVALTLVTLECSTEDAEKLIEILAPYFEPPTLERQLRVKAFDPYKQLYPKEGAQAG